MQGQYGSSYPAYPSTPISPTRALPSQLPMGHHYPGHTDHAHHSLSSSYSAGHMIGGHTSGQSTPVEGMGGQAGDGSMSRSQSAESADAIMQDESGKASTSPKKKPRITLARGGACVACRNRKLKCSGDRPCKTCMKAQTECRYEEIPKKKPRAVLLEERVVELEALLIARGETLPPSQLTGTHSTSPNKDEAASDTKRPSISSTESNQSIPEADPNPPEFSLMSFKDLPPNMASMNSGTIDISPGSALERALVEFILPYTPHLMMPIHPQRFLALISLPVSDPQRPHPAFLYIIFAEAVRFLENGTPRPSPPAAPRQLFPVSYAASMPSAPSIDPEVLLEHVRGMSLSFCERARAELDAGIRSVDRPLDLLRAAIGITRYLYTLGRFVEGWTIPVARLLVSCGLHRQSGIHIPPGSSADPSSGVPAPYASAYQYMHSHSLPHGVTGLPILRMRPVVIPPPRDEIDVAERTMLFWAAKVQDWSASIGWGWSLAMADEECTVQFPWGWGGVEARPPHLDGRHLHIADLYDAQSPINSSPYPDTTYALAIQSLALLHRASHLFDLPEGSVPTPHQPRPSHIPSLAAVQSVRDALLRLRKRIPAQFQDSSNQSPPSEEPYDGGSDPWWILLHANLYTAEMMMWKEMAHHQRQGYESAVSCARALVDLVKRLRPEAWAHVDMIVGINLSLAARFLNKEAQRLASSGSGHVANMAAEEAEILRVCLARDYCKYLPMASLHAMIVQRVKEGWPEKEGEFERV